MNAPEQIVLIRQHLIDPEVCIRCNTCEETCPIDAITHDDRNYVVDPAICNGCNACISPCPTGSIDHWRNLPRSAAYSLEEQFSWDELPPQQDVPEDSAVETPAETAVEPGLDCPGFDLKCVGGVFGGPVEQYPAHNHGPKPYVESGQRPGDLGISR